MPSVRWAQRRLVRLAFATFATLPLFATGGEAQAPRQNRLTNPSFEQGFTGWLTSSVWTPWLDVVPDCDTPWGTACLAIRTVPDRASGGYVWQTLTEFPEHVQYVSVRYRLSGLPGSGMLQLSAWGSHLLQFTSASSNECVIAWCHLEFSTLHSGTGFIIGAGAAPAFPAPAPGTPLGNPVTVYLDHMQVVDYGIVPEPATSGLVASALVVLAVAARQRRRA